jgi:hypothetical protein
MHHTKLSVLVAGGSIPGEGMEALATAQSLELVATDVSFGPLTVLVCDAHDIPFDRLTSFYLKYLDYCLVHKPAAIDAVSGFYFMERQVGRVLSDRELIRSTLA